MDFSLFLRYELLLRRVCIATTVDRFIYDSKMIVKWGLIRIPLGAIGAFQKRRICETELYGSREVFALHVV